jgi:hypothetical protein
VLIAAAMLPLLACNPRDTPLQRAGGRCEVGVIGDSLVVGARDHGHLVAKLQQRGCTVRAVDARVGRSTSAGADVAEHWRRVGAMPAILIVGLGTNDCVPSVFERHMRRIYAAAGPHRPIVWVNTWRPGCDLRINHVLDRFQNSELNARPDLGNVWILDHWAWIDRRRHLLWTDGIHLTKEAGYPAHADRLVGAIFGEA